MEQLLFKHSPPAAHAFLHKSLAALKDAQVEIIIGAESQVYSDNFYSAGYFNNQPLTFAVAVGKDFKDWFLVYIHEYCHFIQNVERPEWFHDSSTQIEQLFKWVDGEIELPSETVELYTRTARDLEYDCEKRVLANLEVFGIVDLINTHEYAQKANSYFNFYNYVGKHRVWYHGGREPYMQKHIWQQFSGNLQVEDDMTQAREALFAQCV